MSFDRVAVFLGTASSDVFRFAGALLPPSGSREAGALLLLFGADVPFGPEFSLSSWRSSFIALPAMLFLFEPATFLAVTEVVVSSLSIPKMSSEDDELWRWDTTEGPDELERLDEDLSARVIWSSSPPTSSFPGMAKVTLDSEMRPLDVRRLNREYIPPKNYRKAQ